jgi:hypothetical protein
VTGIIWDGKTLSADTAYFNRGGNVIARYSLKIEKWSKGYVATAGKVTDGVLFRAWLESGDEGDPPSLSKAFEAFVSEDGKLFLYTKELVPESVKPPVAIGSAGDDLEVLCRVGFSGPEALKKAMEWRTDIGGEIQTVKI